MADNDEVSGADSADTPYIPTGPRRSTYTPPTGDYPPLFGQTDSSAPRPERAEPERAEPQQTETEHTEAAQGPYADNDAPSAELPDPPKRRSLQDDELVRTLSIEIQEPANTLSAIEQLQAELQLREQEAQEFSAWEQRMRTIGTPEALETIAEVVPSFTGVIPIIPMQQQALPEPETEAPWPREPERAASEPAGHEPVEPEPVEPEPAGPQLAESSASAPQSFVNPEQFPPPRAEERVEVPSEQEPNLSDHIVFVPPWLSERQAESAVASEPRGPEPRDETDTTAEEAETASHEPGEPDEPEEPTEPGSPHVPDNGGLPAAPIVYELVDPPRAEAAATVPPAPVADEVPLHGAEPDVSESTATEPEPASHTAPEASTEDSIEHPVEELAEQAAETPAAEIPAAEIPAAETAESPVDEPTERAVEELADQPADRAADPFDVLLAGGGPEPIAENSQPLVPSIEPAPGVTPVPAAPDTGEHQEEQSGAEEQAQEEAQGAPVDERPKPGGVFSVELTAEEATPVALRAGRAARMFWLWFATNSSAVSIAFGAALLGLGMSLRQAILAAFIGVAISFLPLGLGTLAGKWSGQPTIVVSRATFGLVGNIVPAILALVTRLFWGAALLWLLAVCTARILVGAALNGPLDEAQLSYGAATVAVAIAFAIAFFGYPLFARVQLVLSIVSGVLIIGLFAVTWPQIDFRTALTVSDGPWILVVTGVVLVFSFVGLVWANASGDLARYQRTSGSGASASLWASFGATLPAFLLIAYGALLAASNPDAARGLVANPVDTIASMIPGWYPIPLLAVTALSLLAGVALSLYSGGFVLRAIGVSLPRHLSVVVMGVVVFAATLLMILSGAGVSEVFRDLTTSLAVPIAAWAGIFGAEVMIRRRGFHEESLLRPGGIYPSVNWVNLVMLVVASVIGFGFTTAHVAWLSWQGYGLVFFGFPLTGEVAGSDLGVLIALVLGLLTPLAAGISTVRQQELPRP